ncbi:hypothetical protein PRJ39_13365 [Lysobacter enzymogenes]|uniref:hypothetical protein n=1 Tax=Lysobacter enzymogenes TaxID=69 RepID=UPI003749FC9A
MDPSNDDNAALAQAETVRTPTPAAPSAALASAAFSGDPSHSAALTDPEKVRIWQQRFFEAQASFEEYLMARGGMPAIHDWIEANSAITARRFALVEPARERRADYTVARFVNQLRCYDSDISRRFDAASNSFEITNRDCGILRYRQEAARAQVRLTFESPCEYCTRLNSRIMQKYADSSSIEVDYAERGCQWRVAFPANGAD